MAENDVLHADEFREKLRILSDAAITVFAIRTREPFRALWELHRWKLEQELQTFKIWTVLTGWQDFNTGDDNQQLDFTTPSTQDGAVQLSSAMGKIRTEFGDGCYVVFGGHWALEDPGIQQHVKNLTQHCIDNQKRIIFVFPEITTIPGTIEDDIFLLDFKTPSMAELREVWDREIANVDTEYQPEFDEDQINTIMRSALGMTVQEFSNAVAVTLVEKSKALEEKTVEPMDFSRIILRNKTEIIKRADILELLPETDIKEVGGLDLLKAWLYKRADALTSDEAREFGIDPPKGVLIVGPPGGGKSMTAKACAAIMGVAGIKFDIGKVFGSLVGQSEQRTRKALAMIDAMAPCLVLCDEVDKGLGGIGGSGDSGTSQRVLGTILNWMQDRNADGKKPPVFLVFTANNVIGLPPELMRKGRLDEIFAVTFPEEVERAAILKIHVEKRGHEITDDELKSCAKATKGFVGAELESLVTECLIDLFAEKKLHPKNTTKTLAGLIEASAKVTVPLSVAFSDKVKSMNEWAKNNAKPASTGMTFEEPVKPTIAGQKTRSLRRITGPVKPRNTSN